MKRNLADIGCTCYRLRQAARLVSRTYDQFLAPSGINIGQFGMLVTMAAMEGGSISKLAEVLQMERTTLTRNLLPLKKLGYVAVEPSPDKRARALRLTNTGKAALAAAQPMWQAAQRSLEQRLGRAEVKSLNATLENTLDRISA